MLNNKWRATLLVTLMAASSPALAEDDLDLDFEMEAPVERMTGSIEKKQNPLRWVELRHGQRTEPTDLNDETHISEIRAQFGHQDTVAGVDIKLRADLLADAVLDNGSLDVRELSFTPTTPQGFEVTVGRQIINWSLPDTLSINDLFPKDYNAYFMGRDAEGEYMKLPSDALQLNLTSPVGKLDLVYTPNFVPYTIPTGERLSYASANGTIQGETNPMQIDEQALAEDTLHARYSNQFGESELFLFMHHGYWPVPNAMDATTGSAYYAPLQTYGSGVRTPLLTGLFTIEFAYYDSLDDNKGDNPMIPNDQLRSLLKYDFELVKNLNMTVQYYQESRQEQTAYVTSSLANGMVAANQQHEAYTLRLNQMLMKQTLTLSFFSFYSPTDEDYYLRLNVQYQPDDHWAYNIGTSHFDGKQNATRWAQYKENSNIMMGLRYYWN